MKPVVTRTWAPRGQTPVLESKTSFSKVSTIGAITTSGQFLQQTYSSNIDGEKVLDFFKHLLCHVQGKIVVILDNASIHKTKKLTDFLAAEPRLKLEYLPPYSPELNPAELIWAYVKKNMLANFCSSSISDLKSRLVRSWQRIRYIKLPLTLAFRGVAM